MSDSNEFYRPRDAAKRIGVSPSGLRRLASIYSARYGTLPRDSETDDPNAPRLWPMEAIERLEKARVLVQAGKSRSIDEALEKVEKGLEIDTELQPLKSNDSLATNEKMLEVIQAMMQEIEALKLEVRQLRTQREVKIELPISKKEGLLTRLWKAVFPD